MISYRTVHQNLRDCMLVRSFIVLHEAGYNELYLGVTEGRPHGGLQLPHERNRGTGAELSSLGTETGPEGTELGHGAGTGEGQAGC